MKRFYLIIFAVVCLLPIAVWFLKFTSGPLSNIPEEWATFANYLSGTVGVLVTLAGFTIIYLTYDKQVDDAYSQSFESTLFKLIDYQQNIMRNVTSRKTTESGFASFIYWTGEFTSYLTEQANSIKQDADFYPKLTVLVQDIYPKAYEKSLYKLGNYFRHLYHIFKYINESRLSDEKKQSYAKLVRAQLSAEEMLLVGIDGMTIYGEKFKPLIEKYSLLHRLMSFDYWRAMFISFYQQNAFGDEDLKATLPKGNEEQMYWYQLLSQRSQSKEA
jgi:hypothetical protein